MFGKGLKFGDLLILLVPRHAPKTGFQLYYGMLWEVGPNLR